MTIEYKINTPLQASEVADVFKKSGINRPVDNLALIQKMIDHAGVILTAWDGDNLVGIARAITDFSFCCYLSDLAVDKECQRMGIGRTLVDKLREYLGPEVSLLLLSAPTAMDYYPHIGFDNLDNAFIIRRVVVKS
ncbi:MAG: GNAT family N-acetyltransferase [Candidatus Pristimantibacillus sp.]